MRILIHDTATPVVAKAFESLGHEVVGYVPPAYDRLSVTDQLMSKPPKGCTADVVATSAHFSKGREVKALMKAYKAPFLFWDLGNVGMTRRTYAESVTGLQVEGYDCSFLLELDPSDYGLNLKSSHNFLVASAQKLDLQTPPPKSPFVRHTLDEIIDHDKDFAVDVNTSTFGKIVGNKHLKKPPSHKYLGAPYILIKANTAHLLTPSEACAIVGVPIELEADLIRVCFHKPLLIEMLMNEAPFDMWVDMITRVFGEQNGD